MVKYPNDRFSPDRAAPVPLHCFSNTHMIKTIISYTGLGLFFCLHFSALIKLLHECSESETCSNKFIDLNLKVSIEFTNSKQYDLNLNIYLVLF